LFVPKVAERSIVTPTEEAAPSPPVVQEDPITDEEEKESGVDEEPISREISSSQEPEVEITQEPTITKIKEPVEEPKVREPVIEKPRVEEPKVEEPKIEEPKIEEPKTEEPIVEEPKVEEPKIEEPMVEESTSEPTVGAKDSDKDEPNTSTREIKQEEQASIVVQEESEDEFKDAAEQSASIVSEQKPIVTEKEEEPIAKKEEEPEVPVVVEEEKKEFDIIPTGPKLTAPTRVRIGAGRARRSPQASQEPSQMEVLQKELESAPEEEVKKPVIPEKPASPPAKPIKPIFAKFPTPFAVGAEEISKRNLKPTQTRRLWDEKPAEESQPATTTAASTDEEPVRPSGVKNIASRFNFNGGGSGSNEVLETKLKNHTKNEVEKVRKEFEQLLQEEREKRINLEKIVQELLEKVEALGGNN
jgi:phosphohistidine swiveling domain-containing protein